MTPICTLTQDAGFALLAWSLVLAPAAIVATLAVVAVVARRRRRILPTDIEAFGDVPRVP